MSPTLLLNEAVLRVDEVCSRVQLGLFEGAGTLVTVLIHNLFLNEEESRQDICYPQQGTTLDHLRRFICYFQGCGYRFVSPQEIVDGLDPRGKHVLLSFDDGYYNNRRALPLMEEYDVPGLFFVIAGPIQSGSAYWWDVLYRTRRRQGLAVPFIYAEIAQRIAANTSDIEEQIQREAAGEAFFPIGDLDRAFRPDELREFAVHPKVWIGNHTWTHAYLPVYTIEEARSEIVKAQETVRAITGKTPLAIAYPYGAWTPQLVEVAIEAGLRLGFTTARDKETVSSTRDPRRRMVLGRFGVYADPSIEKQCDHMRSDLMWHARYHHLVSQVKYLTGRKKWYGG